MTEPPSIPERSTMNGKPVFTVPAKSVLNLNSGFRQKLLCDGPTFTTGSACAYSCTFCYVEELMRKNPHWRKVMCEHPGSKFENVVIRRAGAVEALRQQLTFADGRPRFNGPEQEGRVIYASPLVDVAANMELVRETVEACKLILDLTPWHIRLLSKSNLLPKIAQALGEWSPDSKRSVIYGVSTGTLDDELAAAFEKGTPLVSKRLSSLHWLQDHGFRTFGMICPSLPQDDYDSFAREMKSAIRAEKCEHVWAEVINVRGESFTRTIEALNESGQSAAAEALIKVCESQDLWERYARDTFEAHVRAGYRPGQLRFLQYITKHTRDWWAAHQDRGAILL